MTKSVKKRLKEICTREVGSKSLNWIKNLVEPYIPFQVSYNSPYNKEDYFFGLLYASLTKGSAESSDLFTSPDTILRRCKFPLDKLRDVRDNMLYGITNTAKKFGLLKHPIDIAIDPFDKPYYGDKNDIHVVGTKNKAGTNYAHSFVCADSVINGERFNLSFADRTIYTKDSKLIKELIKNVLELADIRIVMLDKEFYQVEIVNILYRYNLKFIIPAVNTQEIKKLKEKYKNDLPIVVNHIMTSATGEQVSVKLALVEKTNKQGEKVVHGFITNLDWTAGEISEQYRKRWGIETNNKMRKKFLAETTSRNYKLRFLYYLMASMLHNIWIILNFIASRKLYKSCTDILMPVYRMKRFILKILDSLSNMI